VALVDAQDYIAQGGDWTMLESEPHVEVLGTVEGARSNPLYAGFAWHSVRAASYAALSHCYVSSLSPTADIEMCAQDGMYVHTPPTLTSMYAVETPSNGKGNTNFLSGAGGYDALTLAQRARANRLYQVLYVGENKFNPRRQTAASGLRIVGDEDSDVTTGGMPMDWTRCKFRTTVLVRAHPITGRRALWTNVGRMHRLLERDPATGEVVELGPAESRALLEELLSAGIESTVYSHAWEDSDFVIFDNTQLLHQATPPEAYEGLTRHIQRIEMRGSWSQEELIAAAQWAVPSPAPQTFPLRVKGGAEGALQTFGAVVTGLRAEDLATPEVNQMLQQAWRRHGGLLVVRGLTELTAEQMVSFSDTCGVTEQALDAPRLKFSHPDNSAILRLGNVRNENGELETSSTSFPVIDRIMDGDPTYDPATRHPVYHTDSLYRADAPIGSVFYCKQAPPTGAATAFADMRAAYDSLPAAQQAELQKLEGVCSLHHHDTKIYRLTNDDNLPARSLLTEEERAASPPTRHPLVLPHPETGRKALYGLNSSTCAIVPKGTPMPQEDIDEFDFSGREDPSCMIWRELLLRVTTPEFALLWQWVPGDLLLWVMRVSLPLSR
jgi:alpha-ketoglutarate-dependent taurine dioxygenase